GAGRHAARDRRQAQRRDAEDLCRAGVPGKVSGAELHLLDRRHAGGFRGAHQGGLREVGQGDQGGGREGGVICRVGKIAWRNPSAWATAPKRFCPRGWRGCRRGCPPYFFSFASAARSTSSPASSSPS